jgi:hypothetical protein
LVYYLSPAAIVKNQKFGSRSFKTRFSSAWTSRYEIMALAAHEFVHGAFPRSFNSNSDRSAALSWSMMTCIFAIPGNRFPRLSSLERAWDAET